MTQMQMLTTKKRDRRRKVQPSIEIDREKRQHNLRSFRSQKKECMTTEGIMVQCSQRAVKTTYFLNSQLGEVLCHQTFLKLLWNQIGSHWWDHHPNRIIWWDSRFQIQIFKSSTTKNLSAQDQVIIKSGLVLAKESWVIKKLLDRPGRNKEELTVESGETSLWSVATLSSSYITIRTKFTKTLLPTSGAKPSTSNRRSTLLTQT